MENFLRAAAALSEEAARDMNTLLAVAKENGVELTWSNSGKSPLRDRAVGQDEAAHTALVALALDRTHLLDEAPQPEIGGRADPGK
jgi:hypothetical protein